ncbi:hypothetical protein BGW38_006461 [Lunasporangiospora selenospora]|uniref:GOLD domain-containing protein n=1 Tax=Lunasporangiospora selenospora TaxID=979761 RepID=A0A9P6FMM3_9FUNG|nr:hypothetical protein BGW38_006461 [Lunasporangiospora selenospora]
MAATALGRLLLAAFTAMIATTAAILIAGFFSITAEATTLTYSVKANERACFYIWADVPFKKLGFYFAVQSGGSFDIDVEVTDPKGVQLLALERERQGDYIFTANNVGEHSFCFSNDMSTFVEKQIDFEILLEKGLGSDRPLPTEADDQPLGLHAEDRTGQTETSINSLDDTVARLSGSLYRADRMQDHFKTRQSRNYDTVISTETRIFWFSIAESVLIIGMAALQVFAVRTFFSEKRRHFPRV